MAIALRAVGIKTAFAMSANTVTVALPGGYQVGDLLMAGCAFPNAVSNFTTATAGWKVLAAQGSSGGVGIVYKVATSTSETAPTCTWTGGIGTGGAANSIAYSGVDQTVPFLMWSTANGPATGLTSTTVAPLHLQKATAWFVGYAAVQNAAGPTSATVTGGAGTVRSADTNTAAMTGGWFDGSGALGVGSSISFGFSTSSSVQLNQVVAILNPNDGLPCAVLEGYNGAAAATVAVNAGGAGAWYPIPGAIALGSAWNTTVTGSMTIPSGYTVIYNQNPFASNFTASAWKILAAGDIPTTLGAMSVGTPIGTGTGKSHGLVFVGFQTTPINGFARADYNGIASTPWPQYTPTVSNTLLLLVGMGSGTSAPNATGAGVTVTQSGTGNNIEGLAAGPANGVASTAYSQTWIGGAATLTGSEYVIALSPSAQPPLAPTLTSPANASYQDLASGFTFAWTYNPGTAGATQTNYALRRKISGAGSYEFWNAGTGAFQSTEVLNASASGSLTFAAGKWTNGNIYNWSVKNQDALGIGVYAADFTVNASSPPSVTVTGPTGTITTATPQVTWTEVIPGGSVQTAYRVVIESGGFGSTPGSGVTVWDSGVVSSAALAVTAGVALANGVTYRTFVQITETGGQTSAWGFATSTVTYDAPSAPVVTATWDPANARTALAVQGRDNLLSLDDASFESTLGVWAANANCSVARTTAQSLDGAASMQMTSTAAGAMSARTPTGAAGYAVIPSKQYTAIVSFKSAVSARACSITVNWYQASGVASAVRASDTSATVNDSASAWIQTAALTVNSPSDAAFAAIIVTVAATGAANEVHYVDQVDLGPGGSAPWTRGGLAATGTYIVEKSLDQVVWTTVRGTGANTVDSAANQQFTVYDYETKPATTTYYRARVSDVVGTTVVSSPNSAIVNVLATFTSWWVKDIQAPVNNLALCDAQQNARTNPGDSTAIYPAGRTNPLVLKGPVHGATSTFRTIASTEAARTAVFTLFTTQDDILVQDPHGRQWYAEWVGDLSEEQFQTDQPYYALQRSWVEVDVPS